MSGFDDPADELPGKVGNKFCTSLKVEPWRVRLEEEEVGCVDDTDGIDDVVGDTGFSVLSSSFAELAIEVRLRLVSSFMVQPSISPHSTSTKPRLTGVCFGCLGKQDRI